MKALEARVESGLASSGKAHQRNASRIDARMFGQDFKGPIDVEDQVQPAQQCLIWIQVNETASRKAIKRKSRYTKLIEVPRPNVDARIVATGRVLEHNNRQTARSLRYSKLTSSRDRRGSCGVALQELLI